MMNLLHSQVFATCMCRPDGRLQLSSFGDQPEPDAAEPLAILQPARPELIIRELKYAYALGRIPTKDFPANETFFQMAMPAYKLLNWFKHLCAPASLQHATPQRLRQRLFLVPAQLVRPGGLPTLRHNRVKTGTGGGNP
jgi:Transposase DDE domain group 1